MLSQQEELDLIRRARWGDQSARDLLWVLFYGFAVAEARRLALQKGADQARDGRSERPFNDRAAEIGAAA